jgi:aspartyl-tRNA(Asn)/glutamyl-tRNA(Gln) amidotransferase subunit A
VLESYVAPYQATAVSKLRDAGAIILGKTNMDEFGMGASTENSAYGPTKNPLDLLRVPGGSSGGSAASIAADESVIALGEDTGGSIRQPAAFCGITGLKPTYGTISRYGVIAAASSLDQLGPMGKTVSDVEAMFKVMAGQDPLDATSADYTYKEEKGVSLNNITIGVPKEYFSEGLDSSIEKVIREKIAEYEKAGATIKEISLPHTKYALATYYLINFSEISTNLARYDGIRYGKPTQKSSLEESYLATRGGQLGTEVKRRIMLGAYALSAGYYDAYYIRAQKIRTLLKQDFEKAFEEVDVIVGPVSPFLPFKLGERTNDPLAMYLVDIYTVPVNLAGLPGISLPVGKSGKLPIGMQVIGKPFAESQLLAISKEFEKI